MAARRSRVEINRGALNEVDAGLADGVFDIARAIMRVAESRAPDAPPLGEGLVARGGAAVWVAGRKTHQVTTGESQTVNKPRALRLKSQPRSIVGVVGFGFPSMFVELGTIDTKAQPFLTPSISEVLGSQAPILLSSAMQRRLRGERSEMTAVIGQRIAAARAKKAARSAE